MKDWTITSRLQATLALILLLSVASNVLVWWLESGVTRSELRAARESESLLAQLGHVRDLLRDRIIALHGLVANPGSKGDFTRFELAQGDLPAALQRMRSLLVDKPEPRQSLSRLGDHETLTIQPALTRFLELLQSNPGSARQHFDAVLLRAQQEQAQLVQHLQLRLERLMLAESAPEGLAQPAVLACVVLLLGLSLLAGLHLTRAVNEPLQKLVLALDRMRRGDFTSRLEVRRADEFGVLADGLNRMADDLANLVARVQQSGAQVHTSAGEITASAAQQRTIAESIASATLEVRASSGRIQSTSASLARTLADVTQVVSGAASLAGSSQDALVRMGGTMKQISAAAQNINSKLEVLSEKAANISQVVTTITKVADQTNLLSLNAAIEAEKAGDAGRGFAVVAAEIRRLADQTAEASFDIEQLVREMQSAVGAGVMAMDKFSEEVRLGVSQVQSAGDQMVGVIAQVQSLTPRFEDVSQGMKTQATGAQQIAAALGQINESAQQTVLGLRAAGMVMDRLDQAARGLQEGVSRFRIARNGEPRESSTTSKP